MKLHNLTDRQLLRRYKQYLRKAENATQLRVAAGLQDMLSEELAQRNDEHGKLERELSGIKIQLKKEVMRRMENCPSMLIRSIVIS